MSLNSHDGDFPRLKTSEDRELFETAGFPIILEGAAEVNDEDVHISLGGEAEESGRDDEEKDNCVTIYLAAFFFFFFFLASPSSSVGSAGASSTGGGASSFFSSSLTATNRPTTSLDLIM